MSLLEDLKSIQPPQQKPQQGGSNSGLLDEISNLKPEEYDFSAKKMLSNVSPSAKEYGKNFMEMFKHPARTAEGLITLGGGAISKAYPGEATAPGDIESEKAFDTFTSLMKERYGSWENFKKTLEKDPIATAADIGGLLSMSGGAISKLGTASKMANVAKAGRAIGLAGDIIDPVSLAGKTAVKGAELVSEGLPKFSGFATSEGAARMKEAFENPTPQFTKAMRGGTRPEELVGIYEKALDELTNKRSAEYTKALSELQERERILSTQEVSPVERMARSRAGVNTIIELDITPIKQKLNDSLKSFKVNISKNGTLDFSRSPVRLDKEAQRVIKEVTDLVNEWGSKPGDLTPLGFDTLKRQLENVYSETSGAEAFVEGLRNNVRSEIVKKIPEYQKMVEGYERTSNLMKEIEKTFRNPSKSSADSMFKKLTSAMDKDNEIRLNILKKLEKETGQEITQTIAGIGLNPVLPQRGIVASILGASAVAGGMYGLVTGKIASLLLLASPRVSGEFFRTLGLSNKAVNKVMAAIGIQRDVLNKGARFGVETAPRLTYQAGRLGNLEEKKNKKGER